VGRVEDEVSLGDEVTVKVLSIDDAGKVRLSRRAVFTGDEDKQGGKDEEPLDPNYPFRSQRSSGPPRSRPRHGDRR
jgi:predicted RNA-binding protein with RPS1 domain